MNLGVYAPSMAEVHAFHSRDWCGALSGVDANLRGVLRGNGEVMG